MGGVSRSRRLALLQLNMQGSHESQSASKELIGVDDLANLLGVSQASVYRMVERRLIPFYRLPRYLRFRRSDVEQYLAKCLVKPIDEYERTSNQK